MNIYTVSFFGHRELDNPFLIEEPLEQIVRELILSKEYVDFLIGRNGTFDYVAASVIHRVKNQLDLGNSSLILVLPYKTAEYRHCEDKLRDYYDDIEICKQATDSYYKAAFQKRNMEMVSRSDLVVCYIEREKGGAYNTYKYAKKMEKNIINLSKKAIF